jgi:hypothetical protein
VLIRYFDRRARAGGGDERGGLAADPARDLEAVVLIQVDGLLTSSDHRVRSIHGFDAPNGFDLSTGVGR